MCEFLSFKISDAGDIYVGSLNSHSGIDAAYDLQPDQAREAEWIKDDSGKSLTVRVPPGSEKSENYYRALILGRWPNRQALLAWIKTGKRKEYGVIVQYYYQNGKRHCESGPAVIYSHGRKEWWLNDRLHREDGPAVIYPDGGKEWWKDDKRHREDGPAVVYSSGTQEWWKDGNCLYG